MTLVALALVVGAAISHATWNLVVKRASSGGLAFIWVCGFVATVGYLPLALVVLHPVSLAALAVMLLSSAVHLGYILLLQRGYVVADLSVVYPLARGTGPLLSVVAAILILGDRPGQWGLAGAALVVGGILVIGSGVAGRRATVTDQPPVTESSGLPAAATAVVVGSRRRLTGAWYGVAAGVLIATYTVVDAAAVTAFAIAPLLYDWVNNACRTVLLTPYAVRRRERIREVARTHWREALVVGALGPLGYVLVLYAFTLAPVALVAPARELSIVVGTLYGWWLLREPQPYRRLFGSVIVVAGVVTLALS